MIEKTLRLGRFEFTPTDPNMTFDDLVIAVDNSLMEEMENEKSGVLLKLYNFFNSEKRPMYPREFFEFWGSLSHEECLDYIFDGEELPG